MDEFTEVQMTLTSRGMSGWWDRAVLSDEQWAQLNAAADNPEITRRAISIVLSRWGVDVSITQVGYWKQNRVR